MEQDDLHLWHNIRVWWSKKKSFSGVNINFSGHYRYSTAYSYNVIRPTISRVLIFKIFEFIVIMETGLNNLHFVVITYFVEHEKVYKPYQQ